MSFSDCSYMRRALELAKKARFNCPPNPAVGCVIVKDRRIIGEGFTQKTGEAHAEVMALRDAASRGESVEGATVYVTLEPCSHYGRTPPCALALKNAKVARVVAALKDPNPLVAGKGLKMLEEAGVKVECGLEAEEAEEINRGFLKRQREGMPWVRTKMAMSVDGNTALANGKSQWITSEEARADGNFWRGISGAVLTGLGTVLADNPQMTARFEGVTRQPLKVVVDSNLSLNPDLKIFQGGKTLLVCAHYDIVRAENFESQGVEVIELPGKDGKVDLRALMKELAKREINDVHVEAGARLNGALAMEGLIDEYLIYVAPVFLGDGRRLLDLPSFKDLCEGVALEFTDIQKVGPDVRLMLRPVR